MKVDDISVKPDDIRSNVASILTADVEHMPIIDDTYNKTELEINEKIASKVPCGIFLAYSV